MAFIKTVLRMFKSNIGRFIAITAIMMIGIALMTGIGEVGSALQNTGDSYLAEKNVSDIVVKSTSDTGFSAEQIAEIEELGFVEDSLDFFVLDEYLGESEMLTRMYFLPLGEMPLNEIEIIEGRLPAASNEVLVERTTHNLKEYNVGDNIDISFSVGGMDISVQATVTGIAQNPLMFSKEPESSNFESDPATWEEADTAEYESLESVIYFDRSYEQPNMIFQMLISVRTDMYLTVSGGRNNNLFSNKYEELVSGNVAEIESLEFADSITVLSLEKNLSYAFLKTNIEKINLISFIVPIFFAAVVALVILTTMSRLVEKERPIVGCYKTLGVSNNKIRIKYMMFILICFVIGSILGLLLGSLLIMPIIYSAYSALFSLPALATGLYFAFGLISSGIILVIVAGVTLYVIGKQMKEKPAELLKAKSPKPGKKILLEKIPLVWNRLKFKYKSTMRNIFRNVKNFLMTLISVAGSTALVFAGLGLFDAAAADANISGSTAGRAAESVTLISIIIIICAAALSVLVLYNLTNMIIEERRREIATLKVLGYKNIELIGYVFREVFIMALIGILVGIPVGMLLAQVIFQYVELGSLASINWYSYIITFISALIFVAFVFLILYRKIVKTDMNASLKSVE